MTRVRLSLVAAVARNGVIGRDNQIPWRLPSDLKRFKALTLGHPVIMGRKTFESIGRPLPGRDNIVLSRRGFRAEGATVVATLPAALALAAERAGEGGEVFILGGAELYRETIAMADRLCITEVDAAPEGDAVFPEIDRGFWRESARKRASRAEGDTVASSFVVYDHAQTPRR